MDSNATTILDKIISDLKSQSSLELSRSDDAERKQYLVRELSTAVTRHQVTLTDDEFRRLLTQLDERLFPDTNRSA